MGLPLSLLADFAAAGMFPVGAKSSTASVVAAVDSVVVAVCPSYNHAYPTGANGRRYLAPEAREWKAANVPILARLPKADPGRPVVITYTILEWVNTRRDGSGMEKVLVDAMVEAGVLADDSLKYVSGETWRYRPSADGHGIRVEWAYDPDPPEPKPKKRRKR
jgi:Holliday junction resolvase RusA-like endonuclease